MLDGTARLRYSGIMPTIEYTCQRCRQSFKRIALRGEAIRPVPCPACRSEDTKPVLGPTGLFDGIAPSSSLAKDTN